MSAAIFTRPGSRAREGLEPPALGAEHGLARHAQIVEERADCIAARTGVLGRSSPSFILFSSFDRWQCGANVDL
ncbi:MAG: hypothetical protein V4540_11585, partial [Pseudomonadota bacterium]